jgi:hypothetical protein
VKAGQQSTDDVATIEVVRLEQAADRDVLEAAHIDRPEAGPLEGSRLLAAGWVLGRVAEVVAVEIAWGTLVLRRVPLTVNRPDVVADHPGAADANPVGFRTTVEVGGLPPGFSLQVTALLENGSTAAVGSIVTRLPTETGTSGDPAGASDTPSLKPELHELLSGTGDNNSTAGLPSDAVEHDGLIGELDLAGKSVLDVGSGRGDTSRMARIAGADLVDGFESDGELVSLARLLNAYHGTARVSFFERDLTDPATYPERYDVVLALSAADLPEGIIETLLGITDLLVAGLPVEHDAAARLLAVLGGGDVRIVEGGERRFAIVNPSQPSRGA